jgi:ABC-type branched-subunit amino acid transport system substrate-binding protein
MDKIAAMERRRSWPFLFFFLALSFLLSPARAAGATDKFMVAVVGDGLENDNPSPNTLGYPMWIGAKEAFDHSSAFDGLRQYMELVPTDDHANVATADARARELRIESRVLAVIGHSTSGTTEAAAWLYEQFGIPLLAPAATSSTIMCAPAGEQGIQHYLNLLFQRQDCDIEPKQVPGRRRLSNVFRLPPSDQKAQAPAVVTMTERLVDPGVNPRVYLISNESSETVGYCAPLHDAIFRLLPTSYHVTPIRAKSNQEVMAKGQDIRTLDPAVVILCDYAEGANLLIAGLRAAYAKVPSAKRPAILMTDGCKDNKLDVTGFKVYLTFPTRGIRSYNFAFSQSDEMSDYRSLRGLVDARVRAAEKTNGHYEESIEMYGYDAMLILAQVAAKCHQRNQLGRSCVMATLKDDRDLAGVVDSYTFEAGEHLANYFVFTADGTRTAKPALQYETSLDITKAEILRQLQRRR